MMFERSRGFSWRVWAALALLAGLSACGGGFFVPRQHKAEYLSARAGWETLTVAAPPFTVAASVSPRHAAGSPLVVYLEGDGLAFLGPHTVSADPTPDDPVALRMALAHPSGPVAYLARPCQYGMAGPCRPAYWTSHRYAPEVVAGLNVAIDGLKRRVGAERVILVGYSGGGAVAVLAAAKRGDVAGIVTVAGNIDLAVWTARERLTPLSGSLDPADAAADLAAIPQVHFVGGRDDVVSAEVGRSYLRRSGGSGSVRLVVMEDFGHVCCWADDWSRLAGDPALSVIPGWRQGR